MTTNSSYCDILRKDYGDSLISNLGHRSISLNTATSVEQPLGVSGRLGLG